MEKKYEIRNKDDSFKELIKDRNDLEDTVKGLDPVYELRKKNIVIKVR